MKKIHDIKIRKKRAAPKSNRNSEHNFADFWPAAGKQHDHLKLAPVDYGKFSKPFLAVAIILSLLMLLFGRVYIVKANMEFKVAAAKKSINKAVSLLSSGDFDGAFDEAGKAKNDVGEVRLNLQSWGQDSQYLRLIGYRSDLVAAESLLNSLDKVLDITMRSKNIIESTVNNLSSNDSANLNNLTLKVDVRAVDDYLQQYQANILDIKKEIGALTTGNSVLNSSEAGGINTGLDNINNEIQVVREQYIPFFKWFMGDTAPRRIMLLFQNNAELRGSGGFMGSYAIVNTENSQINKIDFQTNIYKLDAAAGDRVRTDAPAEFKILAGGKMYFRDANYAVNGPESFATVLDTYQLESGEALDGIIAMDTSLVTKLIDLTGTIELPQYQLSINSNNFLKEIQTEVERNYFNRDGALAENEPKKVLSEMMPVLLNRVFDGLKNSQMRTAILNVFKDSLAEKHILFYAKDGSSQNLIEKLNLGGQVASGNYDYFFSHSTNIGGQKSSLNMVESVEDNITVKGDGSVSHNVTIDRQHQGDGQWPDYRNVNLMRILLPQGSDVTDFNKIKGNYYPHNDKKYARDADHYSGEEAGKSKLSFWMNTEPQQTSRVSFSYNSGYKIDTVGGKKYYKLYLQKEAGTPGYWYKIKINCPSGWRPKGGTANANLEYKILLDSDKLLNIEFE